MANLPLSLPPKVHKCLHTACAGFVLRALKTVQWPPSGLLGVERNEAEDADVAQNVVNVIAQVQCLA